MATRFFVHVSAPSAANFRRGQERLVWGWKDSPLERRNNLHGGVTNRAIAERIADGDLIIFGHRGPDPRGSVGDYAAGTFREVAIFRARGGLYQSQAAVWDDELYPNRLDLEFVIAHERWGADQLGRDGMHALRDSANAHGAPIPVPAGTPMPLETSFLDDAIEDEIDPGTTTDFLAMAVRRREQSKLRRLKLKERDPAPCDICGRVVPAELLRAAHIKRRSDCNAEERADLGNIILACVLGCDALFELGYLALDEAGTARELKAAPPSVEEYLRPMLGRAITSNPRVLRYAEAHRLRHSR